MRPARTLGLAIEHFAVESDDDFERAFAAIARSKCDGLITFPDALKNFNRQKIVAFALQRRLPSIYGWKMYAEAGGLMSYGPVLDDVSVRLAVYVDKILKGAKPADLPVEQPTKLEMVVNLNGQGARARNTARTDPARRRAARMKTEKFHARHLLRCMSPLVMLSTAPPPARECHGCGRC